LPLLVANTVPESILLIGQLVLLQLANVWLLVFIMDKCHELCTVDTSELHTFSAPFQVSVATKVNSCRLKETEAGFY
jgi:hypothetical protein